MSVWPQPQKAPHCWRSTAQDRTAWGPILCTAHCAPSPCTPSASRGPSGPGCTRPACTSFRIYGGFLGVTWGGATELPFCGSLMNSKAAGAPPCGAFISHRDSMPARNCPRACATTTDFSPPLRLCCCNCSSFYTSRMRWPVRWTFNCTMPKGPAH